MARRTDQEIKRGLTYLAREWDERPWFEPQEYAVRLTPEEVAALEEYAKSYSAEERRKLAKEGKALSDGSYPIVDAEDLKNALTLARSGHGNVSAAMALIRKRAKELGVKLSEGS